MKSNKKRRHLTVIELMAIITILIIMFLIALSKVIPYNIPYEPISYPVYPANYNVNGQVKSTEQLAISCWPGGYYRHEIDGIETWKSAGVQCDIWLNRKMSFDKVTFSYAIEGAIKKVRFYDSKCHECIEVSDNNVFINRKGGTYKNYVNLKAHNVIAEFNILLKQDEDFDKIIVDIFDIELSKGNKKQKIDRIENIFDIPENQY